MILLTSGALCTPRSCVSSKAQNAPLKIRNAKCTSDFWQRRGKNVLHVVPGIKFAFCTLDLPGRWRQNVPLPPSAGDGHFDRHQSERKFFVLILVSGKMMQTKAKRTICPQRHRQIVGHVANCTILHFCNFFESDGQILHYRHIFAVMANLTV